MLIVETISKIRRAYFVQKKPIKVDLLRKSGEFFVMKEDLDDQTEAANEGI